MAIKNYKPTTPGQRQLKTVDRSGLWKGSSFKVLTTSKIEKAGRNNKGQITVRRKGGGHKKAYRLIDFKRNRYGIPAVVERIEYDPNRTCFIGLVKYEDGIYSYILMPQRLSVGDKILSSRELIDVRPGNAMPLDVMPIGTVVHNIENKPGKGGAVARTAGAFAQLAGKDEGYAIVKLQSGEIKMFLLGCMATVGVLSNPDKKNTSIGKAGRSRWLGKRPSVRGVAMNPVDHPHGGGEGKTSGGRHPVSRTGKPAKGGRTRKKNKKTNRVIVRSRHKK
ncbi:50S ribosomal protein L2 [Pseudomonadota bacterium]